MQARKMKAIMVPTTPRKLIIQKLSKNSPFLRLYPAENMIGGKMRVKKKSLWNYNVSSSAYNQYDFTYLANTAMSSPMIIAMVAS